MIRNGVELIREHFKMHKIFIDPINAENQLKYLYYLTAFTQK